MNENLKNILFDDNLIYNNYPMKINDKLNTNIKVDKILNYKVKTEANKSILNLNNLKLDKTSDFNKVKNYDYNIEGKNKEKNINIKERLILINKCYLDLTKKNNILFTTINRMQNILLNVNNPINKRKYLKNIINDIIIYASRKGQVDKKSINLKLKKILELIDKLKY